MLNLICFNCITIYNLIFASISYLLYDLIFRVTFRSNLPCDGLFQINKFSLIGIGLITVYFLKENLLSLEYATLLSIR